MQNRKNTIISLVVICTLLGGNIAPLVFASSKSTKEEIGHFLTTEHFEHFRLIFYTAAMYGWIRSITMDIALNIENYITYNPIILNSPDVMNVMNFFIFNLEIAYVFAIAGTALYLMLQSSSPRNRARAKDMLGKLIAGMILVAISPILLQFILNLSGSLTQVILDQSTPEVFVTEYNDALYGTFWACFIIIWAPVFMQEGIVVKGELGGIGHWLQKQIAGRLDDKILEKTLPSQSIIESALKSPLDDVAGMAEADKIGLAADIISLRKTKDGLEKKYGAEMAKEMKETMDKLIKNAGQTSGTKFLDSTKTLTKNTKFLPRPEFTFPYLMIQLLLIVLLYGLLALRFLMVILWCILFPVTIFLASFELTKGIGRNMMEQTVFWIFVQVFYAISIDVVAVGFMILPKGFNYFGLGFPQLAPLFVSFFSIGGILLVILTPILFLILTQRLTA